MKIGDKIICKNQYRSENLRCGEQYIVADINQYGNIQVENQWGFTLPHFYKTNRFELLEASKDENKNGFDPSKQYKTRNGGEFKFIGFSRDEEFPIIGEFICDGQKWQQSGWTENGRFYFENEISDFDLIEISDKIELSIGGVPVVVYDDRSILFNGNSATEPLTEKEIDLFVEALKAFKK